MSIIGSNVLAGVSGQAGGGAYEISRSVRFNSSDSAYLSKNFGSAGNRKTWTWAGWVKRSKLGTFQTIISAGNSSPAQRGGIRLWNTDVLDIAEDSGGYILQTAQVFRDTSAWFHLVVAFDSTQATSANRIKVYVNGSQVTTFSTATYPSQNFDSVINSTDPHRIGELSFAGNIYELDAYLADLHFIDGQALTPSSFAETNITTGQWVPKAYTGTYGTNGFRLAFADNSNNTATTLGKDSSPNGNNWTPNNLSVTAGAGNDSLVDTPTSYGTDLGTGGEVRGNYCVLTPLGNGSSAAATSGLSNGNLQVSGTITGGFSGSMGIPVGKWYWEATLETVAALFAGVCNDSRNVAADPGVTISNEFGFYFNPTINYMDGSGNPWSTGSVANGDIIGVAVDASNLASVKLWLSKNNTWYSSGGGTSGNPAGGTNPIQTITDGKTLYPYCAIRGAAGSSTMHVNFGQRPFAYTAPSGFKALCDTNLPSPLIAKPNTLMDVVTRAGGGTTQTFATLRPGLVWEKRRDSTSSHYLFDVNRGNDKHLSSDTTSAEGSTAGAFTFNTNSYTVSSGFDWPGGATVVDWVWDAGTSTVSNTAGSITSQVRANVSAGFSVVGFTKTGGSSTAVNVGHGLNVEPHWIIVKNRSTSDDWYVYTKTLGNASRVQLNSTAAAFTGTNVWGSTSPTSSVFTVQSLFDNAHVAYCFAPVAGYSSAFSITGNGSTDGPFCHLGFRPRFIIYKRTDAAANWRVLDTARDPFNVASAELYPSLSNAEQSFAALDILSNGFKLRNTDASYNASGGTYIGFAWAESPFAYSRAR